MDKTTIGHGDKTGQSVGSADGMLVGPNHPMFRPTTDTTSQNPFPTFPNHSSSFVRFSPILPGSKAAGPDNDAMKF